jgi:hypothetical protein
VDGDSIRIILSDPYPTFVYNLSFYKFIPYGAGSGSVSKWKAGSRSASQHCRTTRKVSKEVDDQEVGYLEAAFLELHDAGVVDAGPLGKDEDGQLVGILHVIFQPEYKN